MLRVVLRDADVGRARPRDSGPWSATDDALDSRRAVHNPQMHRTGPAVEFLSAERRPVPAAASERPYFFTWRRHADTRRFGLLPDPARPARGGVVNQHVSPLGLPREHDAALAPYGHRNFCSF